jgi:hypothetical protein
MPATTRTESRSHALVAAGHPWARGEDAARHCGRRSCPSAPAMTAMPPGCWTRPGDAASHCGRGACPSAPPMTAMPPAFWTRPGDAARRRLRALMDAAIHARCRARLDRQRSGPSRIRCGLTFHQPFRANLAGLAGPCDPGNPCAPRTVGCGIPTSQGPVEERVKAIRSNVSLRPRCAGVPVELFLLFRGVADRSLLLPCTGAATPASPAPSMGRRRDRSRRGPALGERFDVGALDRERHGGHGVTPLLSPPQRTVVASMSLPPGARG